MSVSLLHGGSGRPMLQDWLREPEASACRWVNAIDNCQRHRAQAGSRAAQPVSEARAPLTPPSTVAASCVDGVGAQQSALHR